MVCLGKMFFSARVSMSLFYSDVGVDWVPRFISL